MTEEEIKTAIREKIEAMPTDEMFSPAQMVPEEVKPYDSVALWANTAIKICREVHQSTYGRQKPLKGRYLFAIRDGKKYYWDNAS